jgi:hypothetical protein
MHKEYHKSPTPQTRDPSGNSECISVISISQDHFPMPTSTKPDQNLFPTYPQPITTKIKEILLQEFPIFKTKFFQPLRYLFLASTLPKKAYSKQEIIKIGQKLAIERQIPKRRENIKWVCGKVLPDRPKEKYTGFLINKKREGYGRIVYAGSNILKYEGDFRDGSMDGRNIKIYHPNQKLLYEGDLSQGKRWGFGGLYWDNGRVAYRGGWNDDRPENPGDDDIIVWRRNGEVAYQGTFIAQKRFLGINLGSGDGNK